jgi:cyanophycin synthetase
VFVQDGTIVLSEGEREEHLLGLPEVPLTHGGRVHFQIENVLAATAAAWALGLPLATIRLGLQSFAGDTRQSPGRFNLFHTAAATVIVDYAHNPAALAALIDTLGAFPHQRRKVVFTPFDRRDDDVLLIGELLGNGFDQVVLVHDQGNRERKDGELDTLMRKGLSRGRRVRDVQTVHGELQAISTTLASLESGDLLVIGIDAIEQALAVIEVAVDQSRDA